MANATLLESHVEPALSLSQNILCDLTRKLGPRRFAVRFWDGSVMENETGIDPTFTLVLEHPGAVRNMFWPPSDLRLPEAYVYGDFDVEGDMLDFIKFLRQLDAHHRSNGELLSLGWRLFRLPNRGPQPRTGMQGAQLKGKLHSLARDKQAVSFHYDVSNEFFGLFLDPRMVYTAAYYSTPNDNLAAAQEQKLDYICQKLRLAPGERLLDIGCGWGGLVTFAAEHYGANTTGVTLSREQAEFAQAEIRRRGLNDRCRVACCDYREIKSERFFDKIATVEVLEHADDFMLPIYFQKVTEELLKPGGFLFIQAITTTGPKPILKWRKFVMKYIFPDGRLRPISVIQREAEIAGLEVRDVESLREHYTATLKAWLETLEARHSEAVQARDESTYRAFRLYLAGAQYGYLTAVYNLHQALFVKPDVGHSGMPLRRDAWYREDDEIVGASCAEI